MLGTSTPHLLRACSNRRPRTLRALWPRSANRLGEGEAAASSVRARSGPRSSPADRIGSAHRRHGAAASVLVLHVRPPALAWTRGSKICLHFRVFRNTLTCTKHTSVYNVFCRVATNLNSFKILNTQSQSISTRTSTGPWPLPDI